MPKKHIFSLVLLALIIVITYAMNAANAVTSLTALQLLIAGLVTGYLIGVGGPLIFTYIQSLLGSKQFASKKSEENTTLYVGNLPFRTTRYELRELFQPYGKIRSARIVIDRATRKPRGYGFVEMDIKGAKKAINSLNGHSLAGRNLKVSEANERT